MIMQILALKFLYQHKKWSIVLIEDHKNSEIKQELTESEHCEMKQLAKQKQHKSTQTDLASQSCSMLKDNLFSYAFSFFLWILCGTIGRDNILSPSTNMFERIIHDPRSHTTHHTITGQQSVGFARQVVLLVILLVICTAATVKVVPESLTF